MSENVENLILEHLRALRNELRDLKVEVTVDLALIKQRLTSIESQVPDLQLLHRVAGGISAEIVGPRSGTIKTTTRYLPFRMTLAD